MRNSILTGLLLAGFLSLPLEVVSQTPGSSVALATPNNHNRELYNQYMREGYKKTAVRNFKAALPFFKQAEQLIPGDRYAQNAISNVQAYIGRGKLLSLSFVPTKPMRLRQGATRTGSTRSCLNAVSSLDGKNHQSELTALTAMSDTDSSQLTTSNHPTFFFYIPKTAEPIQSLEFVLRDEADEPLYTKNFKTPPQGGIFSIKVPDHSPLKLDQKYNWILSANCSNSGKQADLSLTGVIQVVKDDNLSDAIQQTSNPIEQVMLYAASGIWENAITTLADLRREKPNDPTVQNYWEQLLTSVKHLEEANIAQEPPLN
ncbi:MAG: DUF928 domain-containing protein [Dolichospermum sp. DET50]|nr:DUF928 domain-containing protein [Dolichospermum sp. DET66]MBS3031118.1 DUF928 domain-containing protein [Dolichospermum sp. DET67]MBS3036328.1 DUF928 domain-containing protein [Dolichospermum sp. DET50]QSX68389.1 MAG: DUF928 domain-containing protein [Dolichospermum sp. DET69]